MSERDRKNSDEHANPSTESGSERSGYGGPQQQLVDRLGSAGAQRYLQRKRRVAQRKAVGSERAPAEGAPVAEQGAEHSADGLPEQLKSGVEALSGMSMDDVKVHYGSDKPAQLNAHAYAQGSDIHVAPGQEEHLPHEAWHVVQQAQGRVQPSMQMKKDAPLNDDAGLETEADVMGAKALDVGRSTEPPTAAGVTGGAGPGPSVNAARNRGTVRQAKFTKNGAATILDSLRTSDAPAIYTQLFDLIANHQREVTVELMTGGACANFDFGKKELSLNAKSIADSMKMKSTQEKGWKEQLDFMYATLSHEMRHAYDDCMGIQMLSGEMSDLGQVWGLYKTELNAWQSEARAYLERGATTHKLVQDWVSFDLTHEDASNEIWDRIIRYTNGNFQSRFPAGWRGDTWNLKMRTKFNANDDLKAHVTALQTKFKERYQTATKS